MDNKLPSLPRHLPVNHFSKRTFPDIHEFTGKMKLYNYWVRSSSVHTYLRKLYEIYDPHDVFLSRGLFIRNANQYKGESVFVITNIPKKPYNFLEKLNAMIAGTNRVIPTTTGELLLDDNVIFIVIAQSSIEYICSSYIRYHKDIEEEVERLKANLTSKFTISSDRILN